MDCAEELRDVAAKFQESARKAADDLYCAAERYRASIQRTADEYAKAVQQVDPLRKL